MSRHQNPRSVLVARRTRKRVRTFGERVMTTSWPWLAIAAVGALHGLNPANGWMFAAAGVLRSGDKMEALQALVPIAIGHIASIALVAGAFAVGLSMDRVLMQVGAGGLLAVVAVNHFSQCGKRLRVPSGRAGLALWSFIMSSAHGAGLMLVPALMPLCLGNGATKNIAASGSLMLALAAVAVHTAAMIAVTGVVAMGVCRGFSTGAKLLRSHRGKLQSLVRC
jgi:hypothetical protein